MTFQRPQFIPLAALRAWLSAFVLVLAHLASANERDVEIERIAARSLASGLKDRGFPPEVWPTNLLQVFGFTNWSQIALFEDRLLGLNAQRGFVNSVQEKYIFFSPDAKITNHLGAVEILLMNADPFLGSDGDPMRFVVGWSSKGTASIGISEQMAQSLLRAHGLDRFRPPLSEPIARPPPETDPLEPFLRHYPEVRKKLEQAEQLEREQKSRIAARVGELGRAATNEAGGTAASTAQPQPLDSPANAEGDTSSRRGLALWAGLGAAFLAATAGILLRRRRS
jgi:hypothetical protein